MNFIDRITHLPSTIEGTVWGAAIFAGLTYILTQGHCDFSAVQWVPTIGGLVAVIRGALAGPKGVAASAGQAAQP